MVPPKDTIKEPSPKKDAVLWHYDVGFCTVLYKNKFFKINPKG